MQLGGKGRNHRAAPVVEHAFVVVFGPGQRGVVLQQRLAAAVERASHRSHKELLAVLGRHESARRLLLVGCLLHCLLGPRLPRLLWLSRAVRLTIFQARSISTVGVFFMFP